MTSFGRGRPAYVGIGSNQDSPADQVSAALAALATDLQRLLCIALREIGFSLWPQGPGKIAQRHPFAPPVADLLGDGQGLLVVLDGLLWFTQVRIGQAQVAHPGPLLPPVPDLFCDRQRALVILDRRLRVAQGEVDVAQAAQQIGRASCRERV